MAVNSLHRLLLLWTSLATTIPLAVEATPLSTTTSSSTTVGDLALSSNITNFIPSCALSCFESFIEANFNTTICGVSPSLQCLCSHTGSSGYTIGEGATECIVAEANIGNCEGDDSSSETIKNAYGMCDDQPNAAPETHATLTATLVVASGSVFVPNTKTTTTKSSNTSYSTSMAVTTSAASTATPTSKTTSTSTSTSTSTPTSSTSTSSSMSSTAIATTSSTPSSTAAATASQTLSTAQIGGIAGGVAAAAILAALLALFIFLRRRRRNGSFSRVRDSWSPKKYQMGSPGSIPTISAPVYEEPKVMSFTRALAKRVSRQSRFGSARPGTIGLAISPAGTKSSIQQQQRITRWPGGDGSLTAANVTPAWTPPAPVVRRYSPEVPPPDAPLAMSPGRAVSSFNFFPQSPPQPGQSQPPQQQQQPTLLSPPQPTHQPQRPNLTVAIPPTQTSKPKRASVRDSIVTEFAEDGEDVTASALGSALIWRPPNTDANSAATYYVADKWGNWVLGGTSNGTTPPEEQRAELETPISKTVAERDAEITKQQQQQQKGVERQRKQVGADITKHSADLTDSEAVKAAMRHLSSPTIPESVALRNLGTMASSNGATTSNPSNSNANATLLPPLKPTIRLVTPESGRLPVNSRSSSIYSDLSLPQSVAPGADNPMPAAPAGVITVSKRASRAYPAATRDPTQLGIHPALRPGESNNNNNNSDQSARPPTRGRDRTETMMSQESVTTIASSVGDSDVDLDDFPVVSSRVSSYSTAQRQSQYPVDLSPVIESPASGRSPVTYPQIPRSRSSAQMYTGNASASSAKPSASAAQQKPMNPVIKKIQDDDHSVTRKPSNDSPTLGVIGSQRPQQVQTKTPLTPSEARLSYYPPPLATKRMSSLTPKNPGLARTGSPSMAEPAELSVQKNQRFPHHQQPQEPASQSYSPSRNKFASAAGQQEQQQAENAQVPHPQSFQNRINNRSQLPSQSHSRYGPSSVYDIYNDPTTSASNSRSVSQETVIHTPPATTQPTPGIPSYHNQQTPQAHSPLQPSQQPQQQQPQKPQPSPSPASASSETIPKQHQFRSPGPNYSTLISPPGPSPSVSPSPTGSASSALLSKRLGPEKAAAFTQVPVELAQRKWARHQSSFSSSNQQPTVGPKGVIVRGVNPSSTMAGGGGGASSSRNTSEESNKENKGAWRAGAAPPAGGMGGPTVDYEGEGYENETQFYAASYLPATPGWKPQLTPKRRGDDLYLSVQ